MNKYKINCCAFLLITWFSIQTVLSQTGLDLVVVSNEISKSDYLTSYLDRSEDRSDIICFYSSYFHLDWYIQSKSDKDSVGYYMKQYHKTEKIRFIGGNAAVFAPIKQFFIIDRLTIKGDKFVCKLRVFSFAKANKKRNENIVFPIFIIKGDCINGTWNIKSWKEKSYKFNYEKDFKSFNKKYWFGATPNEWENYNEQLIEKGRIVE